MSMPYRFHLDNHPVLAAIASLLALSLVIAGLWLLLAWFTWILAQPFLFLLWLFTLP